MQLKILGSPDFAAWLAEQQVSLAFSTYDSGKLFLVGRKPDGRIAVFERSFERAMGLAGPSSQAPDAHASNAQSFWLATAWQIWRFEDCGTTSSTDFDRLYVPRASYTTGKIDVHDMAVDATGELIFVCTRFSCLARLDKTHSFRSVWQPSFVTEVSPEDRCHLNGMAMRDGVARYVSVVAKSNAPEGWRDSRRDGGHVIDVQNGSVVADGLSMPHSPRWHDGRVWVLDSGNGVLGFVDGVKLQEVCVVPGYGRGLAFVGKYAVIGVSRPRRQDSFSGLALNERLERESIAPMAGVVVANTETGRIEQFLQLEGQIRELYDVALLPGVVRPKLLGIADDEVQLTVTDANSPGRTWRGIEKS